MKSNAIGIDEVHVWAIPLDSPRDVVSGFERILARDEIARADRFVTDELRRRFVLCRGRLRQLIATHIGFAPEAVRFRYEPSGKPHLARGLPAIHFNVSHSGDWALIALSNSPVGIDLEVPNARIKYSTIASQVLSEREQTEWAGLTDSQRELAIMQLWVCKEALLKALGLGIAEGMRQVSFPIPVPESRAFAPLHIDPNLQMDIDDDGTCSMNSWIDVETWRVQLIDAVPGCRCAIATMRHAKRILLNRQ